MLTSLTLLNSLSCCIFLKMYLHVIILLKHRTGFTLTALPSLRLQWMRCWWSWQFQQRCSKSCLLFKITTKQTNSSYLKPPISHLTPSLSIPFYIIADLKRHRKVESKARSATSPSRTSRVSNN